MERRDNRQIAAHSLPFSIAEGATVSNYTLSPAFLRRVRRKNGSENRHGKSIAAKRACQAGGINGRQIARLFGLLIIPAAVEYMHPSEMEPHTFAFWRHS